MPKLKVFTWNEWVDIAKNGIDWVDWKDADEKKIIENILKKIPKPRDWKDWKDGKDWKDWKAFFWSSQLIVQDEWTTLSTATSLINFTWSWVTATANRESITVDIPGGSGVWAFTDLTDVPSSYTWQGGKGVRVKADVSWLEFYTTTDSDEKVKYDAWDTTAGYVSDKIIAWTGISVAEWTGGNANKLVVTSTITQATRDSLGLDTDDTVTFANLSWTNTWDQTLPTRDSLWLDTDDSPQFSGIELWHATDTTITRVSAWVVAIEWTNISMAGHTHEWTAILSTGEVGWTKFLREDWDWTCSWQTVAWGGNVSKVGTPVDNQVWVWTGDGTIEGTTGLTYDGSNFKLTWDIGATGSRITKGWFTDLEVTNAIAGSITGSAPTLTTARAIYGNNFNGSAALTQIIASTYGGTGNWFTKISWPTTSEKTITIPDANMTITTAAATVLDDTTVGAMVDTLWGASSTGTGGLARATSPTFATSITGSYLTASEILITDGSKNIVSAAVATYPSLTELAYVKWVTSAIQTQLNSKASAVTSTVVVPMPTQGVNWALAARTYDTNTRWYCMSYDIPMWITVTSIDVRASGAAAVAGTVDIGIYSEDWQTKLIDVTTGTINASAIYHTAVSSVALNPWRYYVVLVPNGTANVELNGWTVVGVNFWDTGEPILSGYLTVTASTLPTTFAPWTDLTYSSSINWPFIRLNA